MNCNEEAVGFFNHLRLFCDSFNDGENDTKSLFEQLGIKLVSINSDDDGFNEEIIMKINFRTPVGFDINSLKNYINDFINGSRVSLDKELIFS